MFQSNRFESNLASKDGGGMYIDSENIVEISDGNIFTYNSAEAGNGGSILINSLNTITISDALIMHNTAGQCGGGLASISNNYIVFTQQPSNFTANEANGAGGSICLQGSTIMIIEDTLLTIEYSQSYFGGAIAILSSYLWQLAGDAHNASLLIQYNVASRGSALFILL